ncbi:hypothetical protein DICPUDRAFT_34085 [Dictyostelium purpureum]|uniref:EngB-type G domain-containing protein n=1 Tax=Dictyostelium purpureum TaxID=5786 RepID=F0ZLZ5_DICPU|nr:uncharacterized protein DICPUDRAFT_34085 [Dictyostelium purpureum]EGC35024.1 hypothetical protein DICPUDRAFT_34085 [Dictyostelium purpureum]|eukprot:XP_003288452.1 hypothetical protein DICPUDRAFT_34085 [Dictyostelium purpureum]
MFKNNNIKYLLNININLNLLNRFNITNYSTSINKKKGALLKLKERGEKNKKIKEQYDFKSSYIKFSSEDLLKKKREREGKKSFKELLEENYEEMSELIIDQRPTIESMENKTPKKINNNNASPLDFSKPIFTDENSPPEDLFLEEQIKRLMVEQGKTNISDVKIPTSLIEQSYGIKREISESEIRFANSFFSKGASLDSMAIKGVDFPKKSYPQVAFLGKSNAGKSSLLNAILNRDMAYVSKKPGCTKSINFYQLWEKIYLVDLPGYGFAKVSKKKSSVWGEAISEYLLTTPNLFKIFLLIDSRIGIHKNDIEAIELIDQHKVSFQIVLTKIDKTKPSILKGIYNQLKDIINETSCCLPTIIQTSALESSGLNEIRSVILNVTGMDKENFIKRKQDPVIQNPPKIQTNNNINNKNNNNNSNTNNKSNNINRKQHENRESYRDNKKNKNNKK